MYVLYVCIYIYTYTYIRTYIHTCMHADIPLLTPQIKGYNCDITYISHPGGGITSQFCSLGVV